MHALYESLIGFNKTFVFVYAYRHNEQLDNFKICMEVSSPVFYGSYLPCTYTAYPLPVSNVVVKEDILYAMVDHWKQPTNR